MKKQNKDEQIRKLKMDKGYLIFFVVFLFICFLIVGSVGKYREYKTGGLEQDLSECQDEVHEINKMQRVCCHYFDKIEVCWNTESYFDKKIPERCEVIEDNGSINFRATINPNSADIVNVTLCVGEENCGVISG